VTPHSAFLTRESLAEIAAVTLGNATAFEQGRPDPAHVVKAS
jgi:D-lactate dehydrogenase